VWCNASSRCVCQLAPPVHSIHSPRDMLVPVADCRAWRQGPAKRSRMRLATRCNRPAAAGRVEPCVRLHTPVACMLSAAAVLCLYSSAVVLQTPHMSLGTMWQCSTPMPPGTGWYQRAIEHKGGRSLQCVIAEQYAALDLPCLPPR
jgi:hypothetical protein